MCLLGGTNQRELDLLFKISMWPLIGDGLFELWKLPPRKEKIKNLITSVSFRVMFPFKLYCSDPIQAIIF